MRGAPQRSEVTTGGVLVKPGWLKGINKLYLTPLRKPSNTFLVH